MEAKEDKRRPQPIARNPDNKIAIIFFLILNITWRRKNKLRNKVHDFQRDKIKKKIGEGN